MTYSANVTHEQGDIDWTQVIKKESRGINNSPVLVEYKK